MDSRSITIFTDGSSRGNPGPGGWGAIIIADGKVVELGGRETQTTNNRMELTAAIEAFRGLIRFNLESEKRLNLYSDSSYLINGITKWIFGWQKKGWKTADKKPVLNRDLWEQLLEAARGKDIEWKQVGGHAGVAGNERCDEIATSFADHHAPSLYSGILEHYRIKHILNVAHR